MQLSTVDLMLCASEVLQETQLNITLASGHLGWALKQRLISVQVGMPN